MSWLFESGHAVDIVLAVLAIEALLLARRGQPAVAIATALGPAALMLLALRVALTGGPWPPVALLLALSFPLHLADLRRRGWL